MSPRTRTARDAVLGALFWIAACAPAAPPPPELHVMSYNIRYGTADDGPDRWELRRDLAIDVLRERRPHIVGLQEALRFQIDEIERALPQYAWVGVGRDDGVDAGEFVPILFDTSRVQRVDAGWFWFSDTPDVPGSTGWGNTIPRIATWARLRDRRTDDTFVVYNVHFDHASQPARERSAALLVEHIARQDEPVLVTGDFNAGEENPAFRSLVDPATGLRDTFRALHPDADSVGTFHGFRGGTAGDKIDGVLAGPGWEVVAAEIVRDGRDGRMPSDHYPVGARVRGGRRTAGDERRATNGGRPTAGSMTGGHREQGEGLADAGAGGGVRAAGRLRGDAAARGADDAAADRVDGA